MGRLFRIGCIGVALQASFGISLGALAVEQLQVFNRDVVELRAELGGLTASDRVARAQRRFTALTAAELSAPVQVQPFSAAGQQGLTLHLGDRPIFTLLEADLDPEERLPLAAAAERAAGRLQAAVDARRGQADPGAWAKGAAIALVVLASWVALGWAAGRAQRRVDAWSVIDGETPHAVLRATARWAAGSAIWLLALGLGFVGLTAWIEAFPWSEPWADRLHQSVHHLGGWAVAAVLASVPGLLVVLVIALVARAVQDVLAVFMQQVQSGRLRLPFLHADTAGATRRLLVVLVWGLALAVAYPYLPGSDSDAFKGLSVLFGLMVTLGSTGIVTQLMSGLVVVYSRSLRRGDFVAVNGLEGVVSEVGALAVKLTTMRNEEITVPNAVITANPIRNFSKLGVQQGTLVSTRVTIGYDQPWRQVHALLVDAALATPGVRPAPVPFVYQRALSDFYVEYELFAHIDRPLERVAIVSALHAAIQDQFNAHGVQIMSPHFMMQPPAPVVVEPGRWGSDTGRPSAGS